MLGPNRRKYLVVQRKSQRPVWISIAWRVGAVCALLGMIILVHWLQRHEFKDHFDNKASFVDIIYFTMISATTTGYGDIVPVTDRARMFDALVVTPVRIFFVLIFIGTTYTFILRRTWDKWVMARLQKKLSDHIVVAGFGISGAKSVTELIARGTDPKQIVVIDPDEIALSQAEDLGCVIVNGDATRDQTLTAVKIAEARAMMISAGRDDTSILICLTCRHLAPHLTISITVRAEDNELLARQAGANVVINPISFAGLLLASSAQGLQLADYLADLASTAGRVHLSEREVSPEEYGKPLRDIATGLGVRVYRAGTPIGFWEEQAKFLQPGDRIVEIIPSVASEAELAS